VVNIVITQNREKQQGFCFGKCNGKSGLWMVDPIYLLPPLFPGPVDEKQITQEFVSQ